MRVIHISVADSHGGAARAAYRLHARLRGDGVDSQMLVQMRATDDPTVDGPATPWSRAWAQIRPFFETLPPRLYRGRTSTPFSAAILSDERIDAARLHEADVVHLHWIPAGLVSIAALRRIGRPLVWTLHDAWPFTGGCHLTYDCLRYQERCGRCPALGSSRDQDLSRLVWWRKQRVYPDLDLTVVTPSRWLAGGASSSSLLQSKPIHTIFNGVDLEVFKQTDKQAARRILGLREDVRLIAFGAMGATRDRNKGFHLLAPALQRVAQRWRGRAALVVFGSGQPLEDPAFELPAHYLGHLSDEVSLALLYSAADVIVVPSLLENLPNTIIEAMACGTPAVAFSTGGVPELIRHQEDGYLAEPHRPEDLAAGIEWVLDSDGEELARRCRVRAVAEFDVAAMAARYRSLYEQLVTR
jgi:glycosyltransferase involved in cell wall biosynthesis